MDIKNSVVLITSAGTALGSTLATHFLTLGAKVIVADTDSHALLETIKRCRAVVDKVNYFHLSNTSVQSVNALFDYIDDNFDQGLDVLVNYWPSAPLPSLLSEKPSRNSFTTELASFASPLYSFGQVGASRMRSQGKHGVIVNLSAALNDSESEGLENVSALLTGMTQSWAKELNPFKIRVGGVVPNISQLSSHCRKRAHLQDELIRNTEYIVANDYFNGRVMAAEA
ncbi:SDR family oxidoreductase [Vibrio sp. SCSIO 43136]|uniref:SDR family oxidoreductase n=1 Tax=Vibrio sp. SCSIO 43136 TaxID=2819101 RepID=UPI002075E441|nr:SDR family oxidoreductase [Vibrio sp. SCSIO 43136]USD66084.1 SDR family oxidoreductase [Vibrio sp. SCSIO 43136]